MKRIFQILILPALLVLGLTSCSDSEWDDLPGEIRSFIDQYFNSTDISDFSESNGHYLVVIKNGSALTFDSNYSWTVIDGRGGVLPAILVSDQLPSVLYDFLVNLEATDGVYELERDFRTITVKLSDTDVLYNRQTSEITYPSASS